MNDNDQSHWWLEFFRSASWNTIHTSIPAERTATDIEVIERLLELPSGAAILDVPCGEGRHSAELAARGYNVTGLDLSPPLLESARQRASERGVSVNWVEGDMRRLEWDKEFDAVLCYWGSFGYFDDAGNFEFLQGAARALKPGGKMIIDTHVMESLMPQFQPRGWTKMGEVYMVEERQFDHEAGRVETEWTFIGPERTDQWRSSIRVYAYSELAQMMRDAGFSRCEGFATSTGKPFAVGASRLCMVATR